MGHIYLITIFLPASAGEREQLAFASEELQPLHDGKKQHSISTARDDTRYLLL
jgi:hypothetical protein